MIAAVERMEAARKAEDVAREFRVSAHTIPARKSRYCGTATAGVDDGLAVGWNYDRYGNRWAQTASGSGNASAVQPNLSLTGNNNRVDGWSYDADGNLLNDQRNSYTYDAEGRIIKLNGNPTYTYDAEGRRVAKLGSGGAVTTSYLLDLAGNQVTELNASGAWTHSNVWAGGRLLATYDTSAGTDTVGYHFHLTDWLGTQRMQTTAAGNQEEVCYSYPFGDGLTCTGNADATEHHFTGKERDTESGLDYFGARYLSSDLARWMSPDWAAKPTAIPYAQFGNPQSLNLYDYVGNNPLLRIDPDGHDGLWDLAKAWLNVVEVSVSAGIQGGVSGQWGVAKGTLGGTLIGVEAKSGLGGAGADIRILSKGEASGNAGPLKAKVSAGGELSARNGPSAKIEASVSGPKAQASASASADSTGTHTSASTSVDPSVGVDEDSKIAGGVKALGGISVGLNLSQAGRAWDQTADSFEAAGSYVMNTFVSPVVNSTPPPSAIPQQGSAH